MTISASSVTSTVEMTDLLVSVAELRDKNAFGQLFTHYAPRIKSYLKSRGANDATAEDLSQEAMTSVWRKADRFDPSRASAGTWIFTVARNLSIDAIRKERRSNFDPGDPAFIPEPETAPDTAVSISESQSIIKEALASLPTDQVEVIRLSFYEDKPHSEIARELNLPLGTVKSRIRLAMQRLRDALGKQASFHPALDNS